MPKLPTSLNSALKMCFLITHVLHMVSPHNPSLPLTLCGSANLLYISGRRGMRDQAVEHNVGAFSELSFAARWQ